MEAAQNSFVGSFTIERKVMAAGLDKRAEELEAQIRQMRSQETRRWEAHLAQRAGRLRAQDSYSGTVENALLYYFGAELQDSVLDNLTSIGSTTSEDWPNFVDFAEQLEAQEGEVPVVINSPQYVLYRDGSSEWREYVFALVDSSKPFYARRILFDDSGRILLPTEDEQATRELKCFGLSGSFTSVDTTDEEGTIGTIKGSHTYVSGGDVELMIADDSNYKSRGKRTMYRDQSRYINKIATNSSRDVEYALGWQEIEELIYAERAGEQRNEAARKISKYLLSSTVEPEEVMPRAGVLVNAVRALDDASYS